MRSRIEAARKTETPAKRAVVRSLDPSEGGASESAAGGPATVTRELIEARAYEIFLARNGGDGDALSDWLQAERELGGAER